MAEETTVQAATTELAAQAQNEGRRSFTGGRRRDGGGRPHRDRAGAPEEKQFDERVVNIDRVARVVKGGRRFRFRALVVVGDRKGKVGVGTAKGADVTAAVSKATEVAKKHLNPVIIYKDTIPHEVDAKVSGARIIIMPAAPGTGLIAGGVVRTILEVAGVSNALSKSLGSSNKTNIAYATVAALDSLVPSKSWITTKAKTGQKTAKSSTTRNAVEKTKPAVTEPKPTTKKPVSKKEAK